MKRPYPDDYSKMEQPLLNKALRFLVVAVLVALVSLGIVYWIGL